MMRTHLAGPDITAPFVVAPADQLLAPAPKPRGFWWEIDGDWRRWCTDENYGHLGGNLFAVDLGKSRICTIGTAAELDAFHTRWSQPLIPGYDEYQLIREIRWDLVAKVWDGIEIAPYLWERRLVGAAHHWYYGWDCASGCVWNPIGVSLHYLGPWSP